MSACLCLAAAPWALAGAANGDPAKAVSYTHLDVYKRQLYDAKNRGRNRVARFVSDQPSAESLALTKLAKFSEA